MSEELDILFFEKVLIRYLLIDRDIRDRVWPYLNSDIFDNFECQKIIKELDEHNQKFQQFPTVKELKLRIDNSDVHKAVDKIVQLDVSEYKKEFLLDQIEQFVQSKLAYHELSTAVEKLQEGKINDLNAVSDKLKMAVNFTFDTDIGLNLFSHDGAERMYEFYHSDEVVIPTKIKSFDGLIGGGLHRSSTLVFLAQCVEENTPVRIRVRNKSWNYSNVPISRVKNYLSDGYKVEVDSPDGWVSVTNYINKGEHDLICFDVNGKVVKVSERHLFETNDGWKFAKDITEDDKVLCEDGIYYNPKITYGVGKGNIVDITVNHHNHRYFTNGVSSHNSNMGKTLLKCALAANLILQNYKVTFVTLELTEQYIGDRIVKNLMDIENEEIILLTKDQFIKKYNKICDKVRDLLVIKKYPSGTVNANHLRNLLNDLEMKKKFKTDILFVDYLGILAAAGVNKNANSNDKGIAKVQELNSLAEEKDIPIVSSAQSNRSGYGSSILDPTNIADSIGIFAEAYVVVGVTQTEEQRHLPIPIFSWRVLKNRFGINLTDTTVGVNYSKMRLVNLDDEQEIESEQSRQIQEEVNNVTEEIFSSLNKTRKEKKKRIIDFQ